MPNRRLIERHGENFAVIFNGFDRPATELLELFTWLARSLLFNTYSIKNQGDRNSMIVPMVSTILSIGGILAVFHNFKNLILAMPR